MDKLVLLHSGLIKLHSTLKTNQRMQGPRITCRVVVLAHTHQAQARGDDQPAYLDQGPGPETNHVLNVVVEAVGSFTTSQHGDKVRGEEVRSLLFPLITTHFRSQPSLSSISLPGKTHSYPSKITADKLCWRSESPSVAKCRWKFLTSAITFWKVLSYTVVSDLFFLSLASLARLRCP